MNDLARLISLLGILALAGCGGSDHGHENGAAEHAHDGDSHEHAAGEAHDGGGTHDHGDGGHTHEAPETEAFYGDDASSADTTAAADAAEQIATEADPESEEVHSHGDGEPHTHDH